MHLKLPDAHLRPCDSDHLIQGDWEGKKAEGDSKADVQV